jgi:hypothetical protein
MIHKLILTTLSATSLAACAASPRDIGSNAFELANISEDNVIPKSSPSVLVRSFSTFCLDRIEAPEGIPAILRAADYVELSQDSRRSIRSFVVDDSRPLVMLMDTGGSAVCAVAAESRTGQTERVERLIASSYPDAVAIDPARISPKTESAWLIDDQPATIIFTSRFGTLSTPAEYVVSVSRSHASGQAGIGVQSEATPYLQ